MIHLITISTTTRRRQQRRPTLVMLVVLLLLLCLAKLCQSAQEVADKNPTDRREKLLPQPKNDKRQSSTIITIRMSDLKEGDTTSTSNDDILSSKSAKPLLLDAAAAYDTPALKRVQDVTQQLGNKQDDEKAGEDDEDDEYEYEYDDEEDDDEDDNHSPGVLYQNKWGELCTDGTCYSAASDTPIMRNQHYQVKKLYAQSQQSTQQSWKPRKQSSTSLSSSSQTPKQQLSCRDVWDTTYCQRHSAQYCTVESPDMLTYCAETCQSCYQHYDIMTHDPLYEERSKFYRPTLKRLTSWKDTRIYTALGSDIGVPQLISPIPNMKTAVLQHYLQEARDYIHDEVNVDDLYFAVRKKCRNLHELCAIWTAMGKCDTKDKRVFTYQDKTTPTSSGVATGNDATSVVTIDMHHMCAPLCLTCHVLDVHSQCPIDYHVRHAWYPGDLQRMFERIIVQDSSKYNVTVLSQPNITANYGSDEDEDDEDVDDDQPWIVSIDNFLSEDEVEYLYYAMMFRLSNKNGTTASSLDGGATRCGKECEDNDVMQGFLTKMEQLTNISWLHYEYMEPFVPSLPPSNTSLVGTRQQQRQRRVDGLSVHHDYNASDKWSMRGVPILTLCLFLNDPPHQNDDDVRLTFPHVGIPHQVLQIQPQRGQLVLWPNVLDFDPHSDDDRTEHVFAHRTSNTNNGSSDEPNVVAAVKLLIHQRHYRTSLELGC